DGHGPPGGHVQLPAGLLLKGGGGEGGRGGALLVLTLHALDGEGGVLNGGDLLVNLLLGVQLPLLSVLPVVPGGKGVLPLVSGGELYIQGPVLLGLELRDLLLPVADHPGGHG